MTPARVAGQGYDAVHWHFEAEALCERVRAAIEAEALDDLVAVALLPQPLRELSWAQAA